MLTYEKSPALRCAAQTFCALESTTKFPPAVGLAIWANESWWGAHITGDYNFFGITRSPEDGPAMMCATHEDVTLAELSKFRPDELATITSKAPLSDGRYRVYLSRWFARYNDYAQAFTAFIEFFTASPKKYAAAWQQFLHDGNDDALLTHICQAGYATGPALSTELAIEHQENVLHAVAAARDGMKKA